MPTGLQEPTVNVNIRVPAWLFMPMREDAQREDRSINAEIVRVLRLGAIAAGMITETEASENTSRQA